MKRAARWLRSASRAISLPESIAVRATRGSPCPACTLRCAHRCHTTATELPPSLRNPAPGSAAPRGPPSPPAATVLPPGGGGSGGIPCSGNSSHSSGGSRQWGQSFASRLVPEKPILVTGLTGLAAGFCAGLSVGLMSQANGVLQNKFDGWRSPAWVRNPFEAQAQALNPEPSPAGQLSPYFIADAAAKASPAVVNISVQTDGFPFCGGGSGFIVDPQGTILTNAHVIAEALPRAGGGAAPERPIICTLQDGRIFEGTLAGYDRVSDLAVVKIQCEMPLPAVRLGNSGRLRPGEWVVALGSPLHLSNSITAGIVSSVERKAVELGLTSARTDYIQTDAAINQGNSGGPLVNLEGEVVAICNMKALAADGVSFAIPIDAAKEVVAALAAHGRVIRPYIGIKMLQLTASISAQLRKRDPHFPDVGSGILVPHVMPGSPAERAGMKPGDVIIAAGDTADVTTALLSSMLAESINKPLRLKVLRHTGEQHTLQVTASEAIP